MGFPYSTRADSAHSMAPVLPHAAARPGRRRHCPPGSLWRRQRRINGQRAHFHKHHALGPSNPRARIPPFILSLSLDHGPKVHVLHLILAWVAGLDKPSRTFSPRNGSRHNPPCFSRRVGQGFSMDRTGNEDLSMRAMSRTAEIGASHGQQLMNAREPSPRSSSTTTQRPMELKLHAVSTYQPTPTIVPTRLLSFGYSLLIPP